MADLQKRQATTRKAVMNSKMDLRFVFKPCHYFGAARVLLRQLLLDMVLLRLFSFSHFCLGIVLPRLSFVAHNSAKSAFHNLVLE